MDNYTKEMAEWLDSRFKLTDDESIYYAHQPIYGFRAGHCEPGMINRYIITHRIMQALAHLRFNTLLDVGGAEGYKAALVRSCFGADVMSVDLSAEACKRAREIYGIGGQSVDIHKLPYQDNSFDVVLCSETLEHVEDIKRATSELLRVCRSAVIITVPRESPAVIANNIKNRTPHAHIHSLNLKSFNYLSAEGISVIGDFYQNICVKYVAHVADAVEIPDGSNYSKKLINIYNKSIPFLQSACGERVVKIIVAADILLSRLRFLCSGMIFILLKDNSCYSPVGNKQVPVGEVIDFKVPYHRLGQD